MILSRFLSWPYPAPLKLREGEQAALYYRLIPGAQFNEYQACGLSIHFNMVFINYHGHSGEDPGNSENTLRQKMIYAGYFIKWLEREHLQPEDARYNGLLNYIDYCHLAENGKRQINSKLRNIRNFYEYLKTTNKNLFNPAASLHVKGIRKTLPSGIFDYPVPEDLYQNYPGKILREKRNRVILGLLIYQGVTTGELHRLDVADIKLKQGKIRIPGSRKSGSRVLGLKPFQIPEMHQYLEKIGPQILVQLQMPIPDRKPS